MLLLNYGKACFPWSVLQLSGERRHLKTNYFLPWLKHIHQTSRAWWRLTAQLSMKRLSLSRVEKWRQKTSHRSRSCPHRLTWPTWHPEAALLALSWSGAALWVPFPPSHTGLLLIFLLPAPVSSSRDGEVLIGSLWGGRDVPGRGCRPAALTFSYINQPEQHGSCSSWKGASGCSGFSFQVLSAVSAPQILHLRLCCSF